MSAALKLLAACFFLYGLALFADWYVPHDDTDPPGARSGLALYTDAKTGCQYVGKLFGGIAPRVDHEGRHLCGEKR